MKTSFVLFIFSIAISFKAQVFTHI